MYSRKKEDSKHLDNCQFCLAKNGKDCVKIYDHFFVIANIFPYEKNHILLLPTRHENSELDFTDTEIKELNMVHKEIINTFYKNFDMCFYFTRENTPDQSMWHWHRHYMPTDKVLKSGISRVNYEGVSIEFN